MNRSRSTSETSVGLFAFLDVLMSTMGSLILVLMVVTPKIRQEAVAKAAAAVRHAQETRREIDTQDALKKGPPAYAPPAPAEAPRETVDLNAKLKVELAELSQKAQDRQRVAEASHESLAVAEAALEKNEAELEALERRLEQILSAKRRMAASLNKVSSEGIAVESRLAQTKARLRTLHGQIAHNSTVYTFVAYDGVTGTTRRPILIECTREHIKFLQENVSLSSTDVTGYSPSYNPVLAGAQALMDYWTTHSGPDEPRPYVLLIVRPSGAVAYGAARHLLERMREPFGYELLSDDQLLDVPPAVPEAAELCRKAVEKAISQRVDPFKDVFGNGTGAGGGGGRVAGGRGTGGTSATPTGAGAGGGKSPFDDVGDSLLGGSKRGGQQVASGAGDGAAAQPGGPGTPGTDGTNSTSNTGQADGGKGGTSSLSNGAENGAAGGQNSGTLAAGANGTGTAMPGNQGAGAGGSGDRAGSVMVSGTGPGGLIRTPGTSVGAATPGLGTQVPGVAGLGNQGLGNAGLASSGSANLPQSNGGAGGTGNGDRPGVNSQGSLLSQGDGVAGQLPGTSPFGSGVPRVGTPTSAMPPGNSSAGSLIPGGEAPGSDASAAAGESAHGDFPPSILPSGNSGAANTGAGAENLTVGRPTPGAGSADASDETAASRAKQSGVDSGLYGSAASVATAPGTTPPSAPGSAGSGGVPSADGQPAQPMGPPPDSNGQPASGDSGGSPSMGSPSAASDGEQGQAGPPSDASSNAKAADGGTIFAANADEYDAPRRAGQQAVRRWGISSPRANIGFEHDLPVYIEASRIYVGSQPPIACGRRESSDQLGLAVLRAVNREAHTWGRPRENFYWVPNLKIVVCAGGILQYERLLPSFARHGLSSSAEFRLEKSRPAPLPRLVTD